MLEWIDKVDGQDDVLAEDINAIAHSVIDLHEGKENNAGQKTDDGGEIFNDYREWAVGSVDDVGEVYIGNTASGEYSHAEGSGVQATRTAAHAEGKLTVASGSSSHAEGLRAKATGVQAHAEGRETIASGGYGSHAEGYRTTASGLHSHSEGVSTTAEGEASHGEGRKSTASGKCSHAEGELTTASGVRSHAGGYYSKAEGTNSYAAGGYKAYAIGENSFAEGNLTKAHELNSHAAGDHTEAKRANQFVVGEYNAYNSNALLIVGNGESGERSNAFEVLKDGSAVVMAQGKSDNSVVVMSTLNTKINKSTLRLINKIALPEEASCISLNLDSEGNPFLLKNLLLSFNIIPDFDTASTKGLSLRVATDNKKRYLCHQTLSFGATYIGATGIIKADFIGGVTVSEAYKGLYKADSNLVGNSSRVSEHFICNNVNAPITDLTIYFYDADAKKYVTLKAGSTIELWGCDCENLS